MKLVAGLFVGAGVLAHLALLLGLARPLPAAALQGFGAATPGGSGGAVVEVTSLADSGPGTLRDALAGRSNVRVVFAVAGTIDLLSALKIKNQRFITIDAAPAPPPGITLRGHGILIQQSQDIVLSHLRVRDSVAHGIAIKNRSANVLVDHCSIANSGDENVSITNDTRDVTVSWSIIGDARARAFEERSKGVLVAAFDQPPATNISLHHNLIVRMAQRSPLLSSPGLFDVRNNVIVRWRAYGVMVRDGARGNIVNNVFLTRKRPRRAVLIQDGDRAAGPVHISGNQGPGKVNVNALSTSATPFPVAPVKTDLVGEVEQTVRQRAGAFPRDAVDAVLAAIGGV